MQLPAGFFSLSAQQHCQVAVEPQQVAAAQHLLEQGTVLRLSHAQAPFSCLVFTPQGTLTSTMWTILFNCLRFYVRKLWEVSGPAIAAYQDLLLGKQFQPWSLSIQYYLLPSFFHFLCCSCLRQFIVAFELTAAYLSAGEPCAAGAWQQC